MTQAFQINNIARAPRDVVAYDVVIVGAGAAGLSAAIRLKQESNRNGLDISICVLEKGSELGAHIISGAIFDPKALTELLPDWEARGAPVSTTVTKEITGVLNEKSLQISPNALVPSCFQHAGGYLISLGELVRWLGDQAEQLGVDIFAGFAANEVLWHEDGSVKGVATGDMGVGRDGVPTSSFEQGMALHARYTLFAEGSRGQLGRVLIERLGLDKGRDPQAYSLALKEVWEVDSEKHDQGLVVHTAGWPADQHTYAGSFIYHMDQSRVVIGYVVGLGYSHPYLSPYEEFQRFKQHPSIRQHIEGGRRIAYGARTMTAGGWQALPQLSFAGGALIGCNAGFMNGSRLKGIHCAMKSGMLAAEAIVLEMAEQKGARHLPAYLDKFRQSWLFDELYQSRNFKPWMSKSFYVGAMMFGVDQLVFRGRAPWTLHRTAADHAALKSQSAVSPIDYAKADGALTFDIPTSVYLTGTSHEENQPAHLTLKNDVVPVAINLAKYAGPEARYCPAGVYEFVENKNGEMQLNIQAENCIHCKTCDIKDPTQNIVWVAPEGGGGPQYSGM